MKLVTFSSQFARFRMGAVHNGRVYDLVNAARSLGANLPGNVRNLLAAGDDAMNFTKNVLDQAVKNNFASFEESQVRLHPPIVNPPKILALAGNYQAHIAEGGGKKVDKKKITPRVFMKPVTCLIGHKQRIVLPEISNHVDYELELAIVIGKPGKLIKTKDALSHAAGYAVFNDVSSRKLVIAEGRDARDGDGFYDWLMGKWQDTSGPMGPYLVTSDEVGNPDKLDMKLWVNGELRQNSNTSHMIFDTAEIISFCSRLMTLQAGDVIATGTPSGVGDAKGIYLKKGDVVRCEMEKLGAIENAVHAE